MTRKLVTVRPVKSIQDIKGADFIEQVTVDGWNVVCKKGEFDVGDYGVFFEVDSGLPAEDRRFEFLLKSGTKNFHGKEVIRIRTVKLRRVVSQGLLLPLHSFPEIINEIEKTSLSLHDVYRERIDYAPLLDVVKYEPPLKVRGADSAGDFPHWIRKTEQERINNIYDTMAVEYENAEFYATLKMDGSSGTFAYVTNNDLHYDTLDVDDEGGQFFVCSRNMALKNGESPWHVAASELNLYEKLKQYHFDTGRTLAFQGELLGRGIQGTREKIYDYTVHFFSIYDIDKQEYLPFSEVVEIVTALGLKTVVILDTFKPFEVFNDVDSFITHADSIHPMYADIPEGIVYHSVESPHVSFKAISKKYLLKNE